MESVGIADVLANHVGAPTRVFFELHFRDDARVLQHVTTITTNFTAVILDFEIDPAADFAGAPGTAQGGGGRHFLGGEGGRVGMELGREANKDYSRDLDYSKE